MKRISLSIAALSTATLVAFACVPARAAGLERLYILNCGEGVAGDISRWSPGDNVGQSMPFVDNCSRRRQGCVRSRPAASKH